jgi:CheY-like chemotaxis protein
MSEAAQPAPGSESNCNIPQSSLSHHAGASQSLAASAASPGSEDRRRRRRALISAPLRVRGLNVTHGGPDEISTTIDVSRAGVLFVSSHGAYTSGMEVMVTFPYSKSPTAVHAEQPGRVARVFDLPDSRYAVAIALGQTGAGVDLVDASGRTLNQVNSTAQPTAPEGPKKPLILAMDADPAIRESLKDYLTAEGYEVIAVNNPSDARGVLNLFTPSLVIAEIEGEGLPGYAICAHVKGTPRLQRIPVVLTTSSAYPSDYSSAHSLGAVVCMAKPYKHERLGHIVRLLAPLAEAKLQSAPPRPADPTRRPGQYQKKAVTRGACSSPPNGSIFWRFRSAK